MAEVDGLGSDTAHDGEVGNSTAMSDSSAVAVAASGCTGIPHGVRSSRSTACCPRSIQTPWRARQQERRARKPLISVHFFAAQELRFDNWLEFNETEKDWIGMPAMTIHHTLSERDHAVLEYGKSEALRLSNVLGRPATARFPGSFCP